MIPPPGYKAPISPPFREGELEFDFAGATSVRKHDAELRDTPAVDFLADFPGEIWLVECKDPDSSAIPARNRPKSLSDFIGDVKSGNLVFKHLIRKVQCSCNAIWAYEKDPKKPIRYIVLIGYKSATAADLSAIRDGIRRLMRQVGPPGTNWKYDISVLVLNEALWNKRFPSRRVTRTAPTAATPAAPTT